MVEHQPCRKFCNILASNLLLTALVALGVFLCIQKPQTKGSCTIIPFVGVGCAVNSDFPESPAFSFDICPVSTVNISTAFSTVCWCDRNCFSKKKLHFDGPHPSEEECKKEATLVAIICVPIFVVFLISVNLAICWQTRRYLKTRGRVLSETS
jgi:hypothetical protein